MLLDAGANLNAQADHGLTALMAAAAENENPAALAVLLDAGADPNTPADEGFTVLMAAAQYNENPAVLELLLDAGADSHARNEHGQTIADFIERNPALHGSPVYRRLTETVDPEKQ